MKYKKVVVLLAVATLGIAGCGKGNDTAGTYVLSGTLSDGQIVVDSEDKDSVRLVLNGAEITVT